MPENLLLCGAHEYSRVGWGDDCMDAGGTRPWTVEGRTMQEQLSRATHGAVAEE
jgi:hypothetical protein